MTDLPLSPCVCVCVRAGARARACVSISENPACFYFADLNIFAISYSTLVYHTNWDLILPRSSSQPDPGQTRVRDILLHSTQRALGELYHVPKYIHTRTHV